MSIVFLLLAMLPETNRQRLIKKALAKLGGGKRTEVINGVEIYQLDKNGERVAFKTASTKSIEHMFGITPGWRATCREENLKIIFVVEEGFGWVSHDDIDEAVFDSPSKKKKDGSDRFHQLFLDKSLRLYNINSIKKNKTWNLRDFTPFS